MKNITFRKFRSVKMDGPQIRCKFLDQQDIEECGFIFVGNAHSEVLWFRNKNECRIAWCRGTVKIFDEFNLPVFKGKIKNKSQLKMILNMIEV